MIAAGGGAGAGPRLVLVGGGARSGKSRFALARAAALAGAGGRRTFIATAEALDAEMAARIAAHRAERDGAAWETIEEPLALPAALRRAAGDVVLVDCLTLWVSNLLVRDATAADVAAAFDELAAALGARRPHVVLVSNEVGQGLVPETPLGRRFRDDVGRLHQRVAAAADEVYAGMMGLVVRLRPPPVEAV